MATQTVSQLFDRIALPPPHLLLFQLAASSAVIGFTSPNALARPATVPLLGTCVYLIARTSTRYMRARWASLLGGFSFALLLQYLDLALVRNLSFENARSESDAQKKIKQPLRDEVSQVAMLDRFKFGWNWMWSFRRVGTPQEPRNIPPFSKTNPSYVPSRWSFVAQQTAAAVTCYLLLDLLAARKPPANAHELFNPELIPLFSRLSSVTTAEIKRRALTIGGFAVTFYCIIQGFQSFSTAVAVASGLSKVENWRPAFGSVADGYSLKNVWGKFWHQLLRRPLTGPSSAVVHDVLNLPRESPLARRLTVVCAFALSGALHTVAGMSSGMPLNELGVCRFFCTQAFGILLEDTVASCWNNLVANKDQTAQGDKIDKPSIGLSNAMAEALAVIGIAANILQLVDFGSRLVKRLDDYQSQLGEIPEAFSHIKVELPVLLDALQQTQAAIEAGSIRDESEAALTPAIEGCTIQIKLLNDVITKALPTSGDSWIKRGGKAVQSLRKSQLAVEYSYRVRESSPTTWVFWVHASSTARFVEGYRKIAERVKLPVWDLPEADLLMLVHGWLSDDANGHWVMIIDNADDVEVFTSRSARGQDSEDEPASGTTPTLLDMIPQSSHGSILITSRNRDSAYRLTGDYANIIQVYPMNQEQALTLLRNQLRSSLGKDNVEENEDAKALVEALDYMPLAVSQAAAYISQRAPRATVSKYLRDFRRDDHTRDKLLKVDLGDTRRDGAASNSIIATWQISFEYIHRETPSATRLLSLMSLFHRQGIPEALLKDYHHCNSESKSDFEDDLTTLLSFSLIATDIDGSHFQMHRLVQFSTIKWLDMHHQLNHWKETFAILMDKNYLKTDYGDMNTNRTLFPHAQAALSSRPTSDKALAAWASVLSKAMIDASFVGYYEVAQEMGRCALEVREVMFGAKDPQTLASMSSLAESLRLSGKYEEAEPILRRAYYGQIDVLGAEDPLTISNLNSLGLILSERGDYEKAELAHRQALHLQEMVLGLEHRLTVISMNDLGVLLNKRGRYREAETLHRKALQIEEKILGEDHKSTLASLDNLGLALGKQGKFEEAEMMHRRALEGSKKRLGERHPETLTCARNLAAVLSFLGRHEEAESLHRQVLADSVKVLGEEHPFTLYSFCNLGSVLEALDKIKDAEAMHRKALANRKKVLGPEHPHTLSSMHNLARTLQSTGCYHESVPLIKKCFQLRKRTLGALHPDTKKSLNALNQWTGEQYDDTFAEQISVESELVTRSIPIMDRHYSLLHLLALTFIGIISSLIVLYLRPDTERFFWK
ncbi:hypothetical protein N0V90_000970 [Kalmusia sp. IMI 367209]|nr:hypothetical protein N0V90_000970 [Kalmusia sp. IMI 367209]